MLLLASDIEDESWLVLMEESDMSDTEDLVRLDSEVVEVEESWGLVP